MSDADLKVGKILWFLLISVRLNLEEIAQLATIVLLAILIKEIIYFALNPFFYICGILLFIIKYFYFQKKII